MSVEQEKMEEAFSKKDSLALKGIAILLLLFHHGFWKKSLYEGFSMSFAPFSEQFVIRMANVSKICVSLFIFISGYGLAKSFSYERYFKNHTTEKRGEIGKWLKNRFLKIYAGYWFIFFFSCIVCQILDQRTEAIYFKNGLQEGILRMLSDFLGIASAFGVTSLNGTWWYMSVAVQIVLFIPLLIYLLEHLGTFWVLLLPVFGSRIILGENYNSESILVWSMILVLGVVCAKEDVFMRMENYLQKCSACHRIIILLCGWILVAGMIWMYPKINTVLFYDFKWGLFPFVLIVVVRFSVLRLRGISDVFAFLGKYSMDIFLIHTFIRWYYCKEWIYSTGHFAASTLLLLGVSLICAVLIEKIKKVIGYDCWMSSLRKYICNEK